MLRTTYQPSATVKQEGNFPRLNFSYFVQPAAKSTLKNPHSSSENEMLNAAVL
jgi:hypothetical protein